VWSGNGGGLGPESLLILWFVLTSALPYLPDLCTVIQCHCQWSSQGMEQPTAHKRDKGRAQCLATGSSCFWQWATETSNWVPTEGQWAESSTHCGLRDPIWAPAILLFVCGLQQTIHHWVPGVFFNHKLRMTVLTSPGWWVDVRTKYLETHCIWPRASTQQTDKYVMFQERAWAHTCFSVMWVLPHFERLLCPRVSSHNADAFKSIT
jgi:hypothetical protein